MIGFASRRESTAAISILTRIGDPLALSPIFLRHSTDAEAREPTSEWRIADETWAAISNAGSFGINKCPRGASRKRITELLIMPTGPPSRKLWTRDEFQFIARETNFFSSFLRFVRSVKGREVRSGRSRFEKNERATEKQLQEADIAKAKRGSAFRMNS